MEQTNKQKGVLLIQLGTPNDPSTAACRKFLHEFLMDPRVIDIPWLFRALLVYGIIGPFRSPKSAKAYQSIWSHSGSPLRHYSEELKKNIQLTVGKSIHVELAMRYGSSTIEEAFASFERKNISEIFIVPLYPQYASASYGSSLEKVFEILKKKENTPFISVMPPFYQENFFIDSFAHVAKPYQVKNFDHVLMSFHGLPERQIKKSDSNDECLKPGCCDRPYVPDFCYKSQCYRTADLLVKKLELDPNKTTICFQSRLGRTPWIKPFTDEKIIELAKLGKKRIAVFCPAFTADCLETLEEISIRGQELFKMNGGESLILIPSLNADPHWVKNISDKISTALSR